MMKNFNRSFWRMAFGFGAMILLGLLTIYLLQVLSGA